MFLKLSMLLQYLRISIMPLEKRLCYALIVILVGESLALSITHLCLCTPFEAMWSSNVPGSRCLNRTLVYFVQLGLTIAMDFVILFAPFIILRHLNLSFWTEAASYYFPSIWRTVRLRNPIPFEEPSGKGGAVS